MTDGPETIWAYVQSATDVPIWRTNDRRAGSTKYRRADLPPTAAQIAADPRVQALVNAVSAVSLKAYGYDRFYETTFHRNVHETLSAALAAFKEVKE
jgi:hypothetical protein